MKNTPCPLCGKYDKSEFLRAPDTLGITRETFILARCRGCGLVYLDPRPGPGEMARYYPEGYCWQQGCGSLAAAYRKLILRWEISRLSGLLPGPGKMLDVGCGSGDYLEIFRKRGWEVCGLESAGPAAGYARDVRRLDVRQGDLLSAGFPEGRFDLVTFFQVMEHVADPRGQVRESFRILRPGGILLVQVPNIESAQFRRYRENWLHLSVPQHFNHFSPATLRGLLESEGFLVKGEKQLSVRLDPLVEVVSRHPSLISCVFPGLKGECGQLRKILFLWLTLAALPKAWKAARAGEGATLTVIGGKPAGSFSGKK